MFVFLCSNTSTLLTERLSDEIKVANEHRSVYYPRVNYKQFDNFYKSTLGYVTGVRSV